MFGLFRKKEPEKRASGIIADYISGGGTPASWSGETVTAGDAMQIGAVYACVKVISETIACLPLRVYQRTSSGGRAYADAHPINILLSNPSTVYTLFELIETLVACAALRGNGYAIKVRDGQGNVISLIPADPQCVEVVVLKSGNLGYKIDRKAGYPVLYDKSEVVHIRGLSIDAGPVGKSVIEYQREVLGYAYAGMKHGSSTLKNGASYGVALEVPGTLSDTAFERLKSSIAREDTGAANAGKVKILEEGAKLNKLSMTPKDIEFLESRKFSRSEISGMFRVPGHMIGDMSASTNNNIEHQAIEFVTGCILPWVRRIEQALDRDLIDDRGRYYTKFNIDGLLRGDMAARANYYRMGILDGWLSRNEVRALEERDAIDGLDDMLVPLNMAINGKEVVA